VPSDERILGGGEFVADALRGAEEAMDRRTAIRRAGWTAERVIARAAEVAGIVPGDLRRPGKTAARSLARALACRWLVDELGMKTTEVARTLGMTQPGVSIAARRGRAMGGAPALESDGGGARDIPG